MIRKLLTYNNFEIKPFFESLDDLYDYGYDEYYNPETDDYKFGPWNDFEIVSNTIKSADLEDNSIEYEFIFKQKSTGDYYKGTKSEYYDNDSSYSNTLEQVFPKEVLTTIYE